MQSATNKRWRRWFQSWCCCLLISWPISISRNKHRRSWHRVDAWRMNRWHLDWNNCWIQWKVFFCQKRLPLAFCDFGRQKKTLSSFAGILVAWLGVSGGGALCPEHVHGHVWYIDDVVQKLSSRCETIISIHISAKNKSAHEITSYCSNKPGSLQVCSNDGSQILQATGHSSGVILQNDDNVSCDCLTSEQSAVNKRVLQNGKNRHFTYRNLHMIVTKNINHICVDMNV